MSIKLKASHAILEDYTISFNLNKKLNWNQLPKTKINKIKIKIQWARIEWKETHKASRWKSKSNRAHEITIINQNEKQTGRMSMKLIKNITKDLEILSQKEYLIGPTNVAGATLNPK